MELTDNITKLIGNALQEAEMRQGCTDYRFYAMQIAGQIKEELEAKGAKTNSLH